ncbi:SET domain-containing protein 5 [Gnomoniopsis smithogilvyi]|uniref:SET domain-containing protein 5 n=1 Tax=Gnomoniopsis smithogilvyi TaxID=1191159 RepID=A0A9W8YWR2_9PEZI|nr:SET domain-containing protein 5 [Gnomoniopsis smithogilvyi]
MRSILVKACSTNAGSVFWNPNNPKHQDVRLGLLGLLEAHYRGMISKITNERATCPLRPPKQHFVEVRNEDHKGLGLFAKRDIPRGARILAELPLFTVPTETPPSDHSSDDENNILLRRDDKNIENFVD